MEIRKITAVVTKAAQQKEHLFEYADYMISLDIETDFDPAPLMDMVKNIKALDWVRHALIACIKEGNDREQAEKLMPTVKKLLNEYKRSVEAVNQSLTSLNN